jgi:hypothetical protein
MTSSLDPPGSNSSAKSTEQIPASRACFDIADIRQLILKHLDRGTLAIFMRVQRRTMRDVSELLYHSISGKRAQFGLRRDTVSLQSMVTDDVTLS